MELGLGQWSVKDRDKQVETIPYKGYAVRTFPT